MDRQVLPVSVRDAVRSGPGPRMPFSAPATTKLARRIDAPPPAAPEQPPLSSLRRNFSWTLVGNVVYAACYCSLLVVLARLGGPEVVGRFALGLAIATPVFMFANLQLRAMQATDAAGEFSFGHYLALRVTTSLVALAALCAVAICGGWSGEMVAIILLAAACRAIESILELLYGTWQRHDRLNWLAQSLILKGCLSVVAVTLGVWITGTAWGAACGLALAWTLTLLFCDLRRMRCVLAQHPLPDAAGRHSPARDGQQQSWFCWEPGRLVRLTVMTLPLGVGMLLISLNGNIPRYFIAAEWGESELGVFATMAQFMVAGSLVVEALGQAGTPRLARFHVVGDRVAFRALLVRMLLVALALGILGVSVAACFGGPLLALIYGEAFAQHADVFVSVMTAAALWYLASMLGYAATASRRIRLQPVAMALVVGVSLTGCAVLVPSYGLRGAAWAQIIASAVGLAGYVGVLVIRREAV